MNNQQNKTYSQVEESLLSKCKNKVQTIFGKKNNNKKTNKNNQDLINILSGKSNKKDIRNTPEYYILNNITNMRDKTAEDILKPRVDVIAVEKDISLDELMKVFTKHGYSRLPVYNESLDDILGFVHVKDLINILKRGNDLNIENILRPVLFVSPYIRILDLLFEMIAKRNHIAMVVDEFGGIDGLITIEDLIEEIVGDITDEYDKFLKKMIIVNKPGYLEVDARLSIEELEEKIGTFLDDEEREEVDTVGGLIAYLSGRVVNKNEVIKHPSDIEFEILAADPLKIIRIGIHYNNAKLKKETNEDEDTK